MSSTAVPSLSGIVVLERPDRLCVSVCGSLLAELGATVLQVAGAGYDIDLTAAAQFKAEHITAGGKTLVAGASEASDSSAWQQLVARSDIVLIGLKGAQDRDLRTGDLARRIVCAFSSFGSGAPAEMRHVGETVLQAQSGMMAATGAHGGAPERTNVPIIEMFTALNATAAILAALRTDKPAFLDIAAFDSAVGLLATFASTVAAGRRDGYRMGCGHHLCSPWNVYRAADGWIQLCSTTDEHWQSVARLLARQDLEHDPRFVTGEERLKNAAVVDRVVGDWVAGRPADEAVRAFLSCGLPAGRVRTVPELARDPDLRARGMAVESDSPRGAMLHVGSFVRASLGGRHERQRSEVTDHDGLVARLPAKRTQSELPISSSATPLRGIRVVEIGAYTAGPLAGRYLADLGAEVIKVEPAGGEVSRTWLPQSGGHSGYFANCNVGKASVVLDLKNASDRERFLDLVGTADVLLESLRPGALGSLGLGPDKLAREFPRLVHCSVSGFGRAAGSRPALDSVVQAEVGLMWLVGEGGQPQRVGISIADQAAAHAAPLLVLAALRRREEYGAGCHIDLSMQDVLAWITGLSWPDGDAALAPWATLETAEGWVTTPSVSLSEQVVAEVKTLTRAAAVAHLQRSGMQAAEVLEVGEVFTHEATRLRNLVQTVDVGTGVKLPILSSPHRIGLSAGPERLPRGPGADSDRVLGRLRGS